MAFVTLDGDNNVTGVFGVAQAAPTPAGYTTIPDSDARIAAFLARQSAPSTGIPKVAFLARFQPAELLAIATAAQTVPAINVWLITAQAYDTIDLADPLTKQGLDTLVTASLLTSDRETAILTL